MHEDSFVYFSSHFFNIISTDKNIGDKNKHKIFQNHNFKTSIKLNEIKRKNTIKQSNLSKTGFYVTR